MNQPEDLRAWLGLLLVPGLGPVGTRRLLAALGSPQAALDAPASLWRDVLGPRWQLGTCQPDATLWADTHRRAHDWLLACDNRAIITLADSAYPHSLLQAEDPPLLLFAAGRLGLLQRPAVAMVGSRHATPTGHSNAHAFAQTLSAAGLTVVSGLAEGIDASAHQGALDALKETPNAGSTIAVMGTGIDIIYPNKVKALAGQIAQHGLIVSEFMPGTPPRPANFPKRNRIVAGLSRGTLVVEAAVQSGSLITARLAADMGRDVLAIPGSIHSPQSRGCHALIKQGAKLVETAQDVLEELQWGQTQIETKTQAAQTPDDDHDTDPLLQAMGFDPISHEALSSRTGMDAASLGARLLELELMGQVSRLPGLRFQRMSQA